jgi:hypothetical protein
VVSVGNLSAGGSGKTPLTIALAKALTARGVQVDVLSRGYGRRRSSALPLLVEVNGTAEDFGDEPLEIAREAGVPVYVAAERYEAGLLAEASQQVGESASRRVSESASQQASESASRRVSESAGQRVSGSADWDEDAFGRKRRYGEFGAYLFGLCG